MARGFPSRTSPSPSAGPGAQFLASPRIAYPAGLGGCMITAPSSPGPIKLYLSDLVPPLSSAPAPESLVGQEWTQRMVLIYWWVSLALPWVPGCPFVSLAPCKWRGVSPPTPSCYLGMSFAEARGESSLSPPYYSISPELSFVHRVNQLLLSSPPGWARGPPLAHVSLLLAAAPALQGLYSFP